MKSEKELLEKIEFIENLDKEFFINNKVKLIEYFNCNELSNNIVTYSYRLGKKPPVNEVVRLALLPIVISGELNYRR
ncbi:MAG TPA: hypothetical protein VNX01_15685 [Bacteroidia bacterium]|nr:hypothetical protein [Bacteroidia bacterium]